jgi:hypothetical protein
MSLTQITRTVVSSISSFFNINSSTGALTSVIPDLMPSNSTLFPSFVCRAWINFDGSLSSLTPRASGNISSITDNGTGDYTINFITAMPDINYCVVVGSKMQTNSVGGSRHLGYNASRSITTTSFPVVAVTSDFSGLADSDRVHIAVFR